MSKRSPKIVKEKRNAVLSYLEGVKSISCHKVSNTTLKEWVRKYQVEGLEGLNEGILMPERYSSTFTISLLLVIPILVILLTSMINEKGNP